MIRHAKTYLRLGLMLLGGFALAACSDSGGSAGGASGGATSVSGASGTASSAACSLAGLQGEVAQVRDYLWYYWYKEVAPVIDLTKLNSAEEALDALRVRPQDIYSFISDKSLVDTFFDQNLTIGFGITTRNGPARALMVSAVLPNSPASAADVRRGDEVIAIDAASVSAMSDTDRANAFGPVQIGVTRSFTLRRGGNTFDTRLTKAQFHFDSTSLPTVIANGGRKAGYLYFIAFTQAAPTEFRAGLDAVVSAGAQDLIIDLRNNGGGLVASTRDIADYLLTDGQIGQLFWRQNYNDRHSSADLDYAVNAGPRYGFGHLVILTSGGTCSAAETLITGLREFRTVTVVGTTTCGKPYGFTPADIGSNKELFAVSFVGSTAKHVADYVNGIAPDCSVADDFASTLGAADEKVLAAALALLAGAGCPTGTTTPPASAKAVSFDPTAAPTGFGRRSPWQGVTDFLGAY
jgi:carboxyl-terminal processing protease